jgi:hypothetical protein
MPCFCKVSDCAQMGLHALISMSMYTSGRCWLFFNSSNRCCSAAFSAAMRCSVAARWLSEYTAPEVHGTSAGRGMKGAHKQHAVLNPKVAYEAHRYKGALKFPRLMPHLGRAFQVCAPGPAAALPGASASTRGAAAQDRSRLSGGRTPRCCTAGPLCTGRSRRLQSPAMNSMMAHHSLEHDQEGSHT